MITMNACLKHAAKTHVKICNGDPVMQCLKSLLRIGLLLALSIPPRLAIAQDSDDAPRWAKEPTLGIGSQAPQLDIEYWLSD